jgi:hypothetical protein
LGGAPLTLVGCLPPRRSGGDGAVQLDLRAHELLLGVHLESPDERRFGTTLVAFDGLDYWLGSNVYSRSDTTSDAPSGRTLGIECTIPREPLFSLTGGIASLDVLQTFQQSAPMCGTATLRSDRFLRLRHEPSSLRECGHAAYQLQTLLSLLCGSQMYISGLFLQEPDQQRAPIEVIAGNPQPATPLEPVDVLLPFGAIQHCLDDIWQRWGDRYAMYETAVQVFTSTQLFRGNLPDFEFLTAAGALEILHRHRFGGRYIEPSAYADVRRAMLAAIPQGTDADLRRALEGSLSYGNEWSLRRRLKDLCDRLPRSVLTLLFNNPKAFLQTAVETRNYLTHFDPSKKDVVFSGVRRVGATRLLRWTFVTSVLFDLGVPEDTLAKFLEGSVNLQRTRSLVAAN